jgi:hypothetical protein
LSSYIGAKYIVKVFLCQPFVKNFAKKKYGQLQGENDFLFATPEYEIYQMINNSQLAAYSPLFRRRRIRGPLL